MGPKGKNVENDRLMGGRSYNVTLWEQSFTNKSQFRMEKWILYGSSLRSEDRAWVPREKMLEMTDFGRVAHIWQPYRMHRTNFLFGKVIKRTLRKKYYKHEKYLVLFLVLI